MKYKSLFGQQTHRSWSVIIYSYSNSLFITCHKYANITQYTTIINKYIQMLFIYSYNSTKLSLKHITLINIALHNCHASINSYDLH